MCKSWCSCACKRKAFYYIGLVVIGLGLFGVLWGFFSRHWVVRVGSETLTAQSVGTYGLWQACAPDDFDTCGKLVDSLPQIEGAVRGAQALLTISVIFIVLGFIGEILGCLPISLVKDKCKILFDNRVIEYIIAIATVFGFLGLLIFAAEVKNKAEREIGQEDYTGKGFSFSVSGQLTVVFGCCLLACGRDVVLPKPAD